MTVKDVKQDHFDKLGLKWQPKPTKVEITDAEFFFKNARTSICPMTSCTLLKGDCKTPSTNKYVKLSDTWPFNITTDQQSIQGYNDSFCL